MATSPVTWAVGIMAAGVAGGGWMLLAWLFRPAESGADIPFASQERIQVAYAADAPQSDDVRMKQIGESVSPSSVEFKFRSAESGRTATREPPLPSVVRPVAGRPVTGRPVRMSVSPGVISLKLPGLSSDDGPSEFQEFEHFEFSLPGEAELELKTLESLDGVPRFGIRRSGDSGKDFCDWSVFTRVKVLGVTEEQPVATFRVRPKSLGFQWNASRTPGTDPEGLRLCLLTVARKSGRTKCVLMKPVRTPELTLNLTTRNQALTLPFDADRIPEGAVLRVDLEVLLNSFRRTMSLTSDATGPEVVLVGGTKTFAKPGNTDVEFEFRMLPATKDRGWSVGYRAYVFPNVLREIPPGKDGLPRWERRQERSNRFDRQLADGIVLSDLARVEKSVNPLLKSSQTSIANLERKAAQLRLEVLAIEADRKSLERQYPGNRLRPSIVATRFVTLDARTARTTAEIEHLEKLRVHHTDGVLFCGEFTDWVRSLSDRLLEIEQNLAIRYSVYLDVGGDRVVLAESRIAPERASDASPPQQKSR